MAGVQSYIRRFRYRYASYKFPAQILLVFTVVAVTIRFLWLNNHDAPRLDTTRKQPSVNAPIFTKAVTDPTIDWSRYAYVLHADTPEYLCNALMIFSELREVNSKAARVLIYPDSWDYNAIDEFDESYDLTPTARLLQAAYNIYNVTLQPMADLYKAHPKQKRWTDVYTKMGAFNLTNYERVITLDSDAVVKQSLDELFFVQPVPLAMPFIYWGSPLDWQLSTQLMVITPSASDFRNIDEGFTNASNDEDELDVISRTFKQSLVRLPQRPYDLLTGQFRRTTHTTYLEPGEKWDGAKALAEAKYIHFSDWPVPKPWMRADKNLLKENQPVCKPSGWFGTDCKDKKAWVSLYWNFALRRKNICGAGFELQSQEMPSSAIYRHGKWYHLDEVTR